MSFNKGQIFRLAIASLLEMEYQVRFGILEAGAFGVPQSTKRAFVWAASSEETLPEWPKPMHVFTAPELKDALPGNKNYAVVRSTQAGAPFRGFWYLTCVQALFSLELPNVDRMPPKVLSSCSSSFRWLLLHLEYSA